MKIQVYIIFMCLPKFKKNIEINVSPWHNLLYGIVEKENPCPPEIKPRKGQIIPPLPS